MISTCLHFALAIERNSLPTEWPSKLLLVPEECRAECEQYLRDMAARLRVVRGIKKSKKELKG